MNNVNISEQAKQYVQEHKQELCDMFADLVLFPVGDKPTTIFMAGAPGSGKTESSVAFIKNNPELHFVRIDPDEIKARFIPQYDGKNSNIVKPAATKAVSILFDHCMKRGQNFLVDGTFSNWTAVSGNLHKLIKQKRTIFVIYVYQDPVIAWQFTQKRGVLEGRLIPKQFFIDSYFESMENIVRLKREFGEQVSVILLEKNVDNKTIKNVFLNVDTIDKYIKNIYTRETLENIII
ncbi:hypothetical protein COT94_01215 [Candidatus Falkowbacteria bacterium CG10_big_fil_rev_8_21_14_0_10_37_14]|uniref:Zeta toxin domain-containing protein n=1 Tax=Candidatus Falkowbacteria bacterium CG10_big_fil_rev_8_21_14_0_10_37_14 TaxID=1974561 RepID=A0A2M6WU22_9BACT|nr:AAA family ATPase [Candidatus Falkowbacteria bacterium]PIT96294.1 MAG: hypothetical protein COT94_01215 [Candidatus Falkowbacteria bacterium CG10_big_fil_rev_8_21_14_0_10_37_14]